MQQQTVACALAAETACQKMRLLYAKIERLSPSLVRHLLAQPLFTLAKIRNIMEQIQTLTPTQNSSVTPTLVMALGKCACRLLKRLSGQAALPDCFYLKTLDRKTDIKPEDSWRLRYLKETAATLSQIENPDSVFLPPLLLAQARQAQNVILLAGLGRHTGSVSLVALSQFLVHQNIPVQVLCSTPFDCEGRSPANIAAHALAALPEGINPLVIRLESLIKK